ncbi:glycoside hydrolase N-terminal domain-containing protein [Agreia pratensis]|uniref:glycosyl hydrolase family 95 catalytic domain-containing protein n=1 Tax=Agreia pratensis TaxID=150121 RepID=UPI00188A6062|nr:glycoside hydrolase N-terminal domain-containing protein [Agreia pratensis]MBF4636083.1 glycoside hydrolase N-terminal domain-containing protein [Agreia pratensis]
MKRFDITRHEPAISINDSFLLGNGRLGASVRGGAGREHLDLNLDTFWSGGPLVAADGDGEEARRFLDPLREAVRDGEWARAEELAMLMQSDAYTQSYEPLGFIDWAYGDASIGGYSRSLDLARAAATVAYDAADGRVEVETFVSATEQVMVMEVSQPAPSGSAPEFRSPHPVRHERVELGGGDYVDIATGRAPSRVLPQYLGDVADAVIYDTGEPDADGLVDAGMGFAVAILVQTREEPGATGATTRILVAAADGFRGRSERPSADGEALSEQVLATLRGVAGATTEELRDRHRAAHAELFDRSDLRLVAAPDDSSSKTETDELYHHLGRYLLISSSRPGTQAATLQGIWNDSVRPGWSSNYTTNINVEMNYWPADVSGLGELTEPFTELVLGLEATGSRTAASSYGAEGWCVHHNTDIWGFSNLVRGLEPADATWSNWPTGGLWLTLQLWDHLDFAPRHDAALRAQAWKALAGSARFALSLLQPYADGTLAVSPSTSPEHSFRPNGDEAEFAVSAGVTMDQTLVLEVFERLLAEADAADGDDELVAAVRAALPLVRRPQIGADGLLQEWAEDWEPRARGHRHTSHLLGLFPGSSFDEYASPEMFRAARRALEDRVAHGSGYTGWSQAWILCLATRARDASLVEHSLDVLTDGLSSSSLLDLHPVDVETHPDGHLFQIDGNLGGAAGIVEALVQSQNESIRLLNAMPPRWYAGELRNIRARGGAQVSLEWDERRLVRAELDASVTRSFTVTVPAGDWVATVRGRPDDASIHFAAVGTDGERLATTWDAAAGETLVIRPAPVRSTRAR